MLSLIAAQAALLVPLAQQGEAVRPAASPCARYAKPVPARVEGRIISRDRSPRANVQVRATVGETLREYTTVSDGAGRYALTGFDADGDVRLESWDEADTVSVECTVRTTRREPVLQIDVVLDAPREDKSDPLGCQGPDGPIPLSVVVHGRGPHLPLTREQARELFPREQQPGARLDLRMQDIQEVRMGEDGAVLQLTPAGTEALRAFTGANIGKMALVSIEGLPASRATVQGMIDSGAMEVRAAALRGRLCEILEPKAAAEQAPMKFPR